MVGPAVADERDRAGVDGRAVEGGRRDAPAAAFSARQTKKTWDIGPRYTMGPFSVSADWTRSVFSARTLNRGALNDVYAISTDYVLGPGIDVGIGLDYTHYQDSNNTSNYSGLAIMAGTGIAF